jgi:hypothetical protein
LLVYSGPKERERERERERETDNPSVYFETLKGFSNLGPTFINSFFNMGGRYLLVYLVLLLLFPMLSIDQIWEEKQVDSDKQNPLTISWEENMKLKIPQIFIMNMKVDHFQA